MELADAWRHPSRGEVGKLLSFRVPTPPDGRRALLARRKVEYKEESEAVPRRARWKPVMPQHETRATTQRKPGPDEATITAGPQSTDALPCGLPAVSKGTLPRRVAAELAWCVQTGISPSRQPPAFDYDRPYKVVKRDRWQDLMLMREQEHSGKESRLRDNIDMNRSMYSSFSPDGVYSPHMSKCNRRLYDVAPPPKKPGIPTPVNKPQWVGISVSPRRSPREPRISMGPAPRVLNTRLRQQVPHPTPGMWVDAAPDTSRSAPVGR
eukprot:Hpha_TRINITY_DN10600_c0_g1::TRINITY_DN10600_c0_g1_i1::g.156803::m.156803